MFFVGENKATSWAYCVVTGENESMVLPKPEFVTSTPGTEYKEDDFELLMFWPRTHVKVFVSYKLTVDIFEFVGVAVQPKFGILDLSSKGLGSCSDWDDQASEHQSASETRGSDGAFIVWLYHIAVDHFCIEVSVFHSEIFNVVITWSIHLYPTPRWA